MGLVTEAQSYIITSLDLITEDLENYLYSGAQIFNLRLVEDNNPDVRTLLNDWSYLADRTGKVNIPAPSSLQVGYPPGGFKGSFALTLVAAQTESALIYDAVKLLAMALGRLDKSQSVEIRPISCIDEEPWRHGTSVVNFMRPVRLLTVRLDKQVSDLRDSDGVPWSFGSRLLQRVWPQELIHTGRPVLA